VLDCSIKENRHGEAHDERGEDVEKILVHKRKLNGIFMIRKQDLSPEKTKTTTTLDHVKKHGQKTLLLLVARENFAYTRSKTET